jgi:hypothetical protein
MTMKNNYRRLQALAKFLDLDSFYCVSVRDIGVHLQGYYKESTVKILRASKFNFTEFDANNYINFSRGNIKVCLTSQL